MIQMPCPESLCAAGGLGRDPHGKTWYERNGLRATCTEIARSQAIYARDLTDNGCTILAFIGMEFSPACATTYLNRGRFIHRDQGIFIEELKKALTQQKLQVRFLGVNQRAHKKLQRDLDGLLTCDLRTDNAERAAV